MMYGVRPISRKKSIQLLTFIYEKTHPLMTDSEGENSFITTPLKATLPVQKSE